MPLIRSSKLVSEPSQQQLGQWFTPEPVADLVLALALKSAKKGAIILDPSCGDGAFLKQALRLGIAPDRLYGVDIDPRAIAVAKRSLPEVTLIEADFFSGESSAQLPSESKVDLIVGNPPYVRQERQSAGDKGRLVDTLAADWPSLERAKLSSLVGRGDLAAPFLLHTLRHLHEEGVAAMVISSAFLDSGYGAQFWQLLSEVASLTMLVDAPKERWFRDAAVHAMVAVFQLGPARDKVCLARLQCSTRDAASALHAGSELSALAELRYASSQAPHEWAAQLRAPDAWFGAVRAAGAALTTLGDVAEVRRGLTSGANDIFYLRQTKASELGLGADFLQPLLRAPGKSGQSAIGVDHQRCQDAVLIVPPDTELDKYPGLSRYLHSFPGAENRRTLAARHPWWSVQARPAQVFLSKAYSQRFVQPFSDRPVVADQRVYCVYPKAGVKPALLSAILNSTLTSLALESLGRASMGEGALEWTVADARKLPILDPRKLGDDGAILQAFSLLRKRDIGAVGNEASQSDRQALDLALHSHCSDLLAMGEEIQEALVRSCAARLGRSQATLL